MLHDKSTEQIKARLKARRDPSVVTSHAGVASVNTDGGTKPTQPKTDDGNTAVNAAFNAGTVGARETTDPAKLIAAGIIKGN
jgi:hypothetical protein